MEKPIYLTQYGLMAERHWREFRPRMVRDLEAKGALMEALFEAQAWCIAVGEWARFILMTGETPVFR